MAVGSDDQYGQRVIIEHTGSLQTLYAHLNSSSVKVDDCIAPGDALGTVGATGLATEPHLHFEVRLYGRPIDRASLFDP